MNSDEPQSILVLDIDQLITELNFLPLSDHKGDSRNVEDKNGTLLTKPRAWLETPVKARCI